MELTGQARIEAPREVVWAALNEPEVLRRAIPGCEELERDGEDGFAAKVVLKVGPIKATFGGRVSLSDIQAPDSYVIIGEGQGGIAGFAKGRAFVCLHEESDDVTLLRYEVKADVGGKIAQLGARLLDSTAKKISAQFFGAFADIVTNKQSEMTQ
ncbi:SRPBCC family protein [Ancylobacter polymorphus]|uniref:Carbon monoxide dehydrogenase subunit G n=1 Tax=Ancylobacter polymorphus TaxID=223390 RepID=A0A9E6ZX16_9HYPH|nr:carbon monoxide dehydrogenase subunit G [Ancylobacter polymorphus]UOK73331.1 carbon monoxide dehydrogenase subunit G [Ancylobacter polymorphus]